MNEVTKAFYLQLLANIQVQLVMARARLALYEAHRPTNPVAHFQKGVALTEVQALEIQQRTVRNALGNVICGWLPS